MRIIKMIRISTLIISISVISCQREQKSVFLEYKGKEISIEIDSIGLPEVAHFPIRLKVANFNHNKVIMHFYSDTSDSFNCLRNMYLVSKVDTLHIWIGDKFLIVNERSIVTFTCSGIFNSGKGHFKSLNDIKKFKELKLIYLGDCIHCSNNNFESIGKVDTFLVPFRIFGSANNVKIVDYLYPGPINLLEKSVDTNKIIH